MNAEHIKALTDAIEEKCTDDLVDYLAAKTYLATWAVEVVDGSKYIEYRYGSIPEGRIIDDDTVRFLLAAMEFSSIDQLVEYANEAITKEWQRVKSELKMTWYARVFNMVDDPEYKAIGIDSLDPPNDPHPIKGWLVP